MTNPGTERPPTRYPTKMNDNVVPVVIYRIVILDHQGEWFNGKTAISFMLVGYKDLFHGTTNDQR